jgi:hypothetical protein
MALTISRVPISKATLAQMPEAERHLFLLIGHLSNELNIFTKLFYWCSTFTADEPVLRNAHTAQALALARVLASKMAEGWLALEKVYFSTQISRDYEGHLTIESRDALRQLSKYFGKTNLVKTIRNKFGFHYDLDHIKAGFDLPSDAEQWDIYLAESNGNSLYYAADLVANYALLNSIAPGDLKKGMESLIDELIRVGGWFISFLGGCLVVLGERYFLNDEGDLLVEEITLAQVPSLDDIDIPYFVTTPHRGRASGDGAL